MATFELAVYDAASLIVYGNINIEREYYIVQGCIVDNNSRIENVQRQSSDRAKAHRRASVDI